MTTRYLALPACVALVVVSMNKPAVATDNVVGACVTELGVLGTVSGAIGISVSGLSASPSSPGVVVGVGLFGSMPGAIGGTVAGLSVVPAGVRAAAVCLVCSVGGTGP